MTQSDKRGGEQGGKGQRIRVGVVFGGRSGEHDVSLRSAQAIMRAIDPQRYEVVPIGITREGKWLTGGDPLRRLAGGSRLALTPEAGSSASDPAAADAMSAIVPAEQAGHANGALDVADAGWVRGLDVIFPALHGPMGEDGTIQGFFELAGIPYVGAGVLGSAVSMDKDVAKRLFLQAGLPILPWIVLARREWERDPERIAARVEAELGYPCFTKPANLGSSVGVTKVHHEGELAAGIAEAGRHDRKIIIERGVDARELEISVLGNDEPMTSAIGEVRPSREFYDYEAKYVDEDSELIVPAELTAEQEARIKAIAVTAFKALEVAGMARVDFFLDRKSGEVYLNELNTIPGFTQISMYPILWESSGLSFQDLVARLIELALERHVDRFGGTA